MIGCGVVAFVERGGRAERIMSKAVPLVEADTAQEAEAAGAAVVVSSCQLALYLAHAKGYRVVEPDIFVGDSSNTISYLEGTARFKARNVSTWVGGIREALAVNGRDVEFRLVPRAMNRAADELATIATTLVRPVIDYYGNENLLVSDSGDDVRTDADYRPLQNPAPSHEVRHGPVNLISSRCTMPKGSY